MRVQGMVGPGRFTLEQIPGTNKTLIRLFENVEPFQDEKFEGFQYDEYHVEVETWDGIAQTVMANFDEFLAKGKDNEVDKSNEALYRGQVYLGRDIVDADAMNVDQEFRLTMLELGLSGDDI